MSNSSNTVNTGNTGINHDQTINFLYFMSNFPHNFIYEVWTGSIADHFQSKFLGLCNRFERSDIAFLRWFYELDTDHQRTLLNWVNSNYKSHSHLKI